MDQKNDDTKLDSDSPRLIEDAAESSRCSLPTATTSASVSAPARSIHRIWSICSLIVLNLMVFLCRFNGMSMRDLVSQAGPMMPLMLMLGLMARLPFSAIVGFAGTLIWAFSKLPPIGPEQQWLAPYASVILAVWLFFGLCTRFGPAAALFEAAYQLYAELKRPSAIAPKDQTQVEDDPNRYSDPNAG